MPTVTVSEDLKSYLDRKAACALVADIAECKSCGGAVAEVFVRTAKESEAQRLAEKNCRTLDAGGITLYLKQRIICVDDAVSLGLRNFLGIKDITVKGLHL